MNIDQKLSAIKAINEEKDFVDEKLKAIARAEETRNSFISIGIHTEKAFQDYPLPTEAIDKVRNLIKEYYEIRLKQLIAHAEEIINDKSCNCGMNYCDENGCVERKRELEHSIVDQVGPISTQ